MTMGVINFSSEAPSIKTRIETSAAFSMVINGQVCSEAPSIKTRIETYVSMIFSKRS